MLQAMILLGRTRSFALVGALLLPACGDDGSADASSGSSNSSEPTTSTPVTGTGTGAVTDTTMGPVPTGTSADSTTGAEMLCNGWNEDGPDMPWLELYGSGGAPLVTGGNFTLECGGQGFWMFPIYVEMGGWQLADTTLTFSVEVVVEGFPGPFGSFYQEDEYLYDVECISEDTLIGGFIHDCITVFPPDDAVLTMIDGAPATIHIELEVDGGDPIVIDLADMTMSAPADLLANGCIF
jgi:hypothetical protein